MKNFFKKTFCIAVLSVFMAVLMAFQMPVAKVSAAGDPYISDLKIVTAHNIEDARFVAGPSYKVVETPLTDKNSKDTSLYLKTYLCYKTTDNKADAIYDIKSLSMKDNFSYSKYARYLSSYEVYMEAEVKYLSPAIMEFQQNYNAGGELSAAAYSLLNCFYDNDSEMTVADLLLSAEFDKRGNLQDDSLELLTTVFMQGNAEFVYVIEQLLLISFNELTAHKKVIWIDYLDKLADQYALTGDEYVIADSLDYASEARLLQDLIPDVQSDIQYYLNCEAEHPFTETAEAELNKQEALFQIERAKTENKEKSDTVLRKKIAAERAEADPDGAGAEYLAFYTWLSGIGTDRVSKWESGRMLYNKLIEYNYPLNKYNTLCDLIMADPDKTPKEDYYPMINAMTAGQRVMLSVGLDAVLMAAMTPNDEHLAQLETCLGMDVLNEENPLSVYEGVDRSLYDPDGIAMTEHALEYMQYGTESPFDSTLDQRVHTAMSTLIWVMRSTVTACALVIATLATFAVIRMNLAGVTFAKAFAYILFQHSVTSVIASVTFIVALAALFIYLIIYLVNSLFNNPDKDYTPIPRVLCSEEDNMYKGIDAKGNDVFGDGFVFYYGVKNPQQPATIDAGGQKGLDTSNQVMDIYNWQLSGTDRQWTALYYSKDPRLAYMDANGNIHRLNPIKAGSLGIDTKKKDGTSAVTNFENIVCNTMYWYQHTHNDWNDTPDRFLFKNHYTDTEFRDLVDHYGSASVFANNKALAFGGGGLVLGAVGGTFVTLAAKKKKKDAVTEQA